MFIFLRHQSNPKLITSLASNFGRNFLEGSIVWVIGHRLDTHRFHVWVGGPGHAGHLLAARRWWERKLWRIELQFFLQLQKMETVSGCDSQWVFWCFLNHIRWTTRGHWYPVYFKPDVGQGMGGDAVSIQRSLTFCVQPCFGSYSHTSICYGYDMFFCVLV